MGLMGSGKTHWGRLLAKRLGYRFIDLDEYIVTNEGCSISEIFNKHGEEHFRQLEAKYLREIKYKNEMVLALGGGTPCFHDNIAFVNTTGKSYYLKCSIELITQRTTGLTMRPLLQGKSQDELKEFFSKQLLEREIYYKLAKHVINADSLNEDNLLLKFGYDK